LTASGPAERIEHRMEPRLPEKPVLVSRSGGKDGCTALREIQRTANARVAALPTTITRDYDRISMHGVLERQAASLTGANLRIAPYECAKYSTKLASSHFAVRAQSSAGSGLVSVAGRHRARRWRNPRRSSMGFARENQVRVRLPAGGRWIRTPGPSRGFPRSEPVARKPTSDVRTAVPLQRDRWFRIRFPPAGSLVRTCYPRSLNSMVAMSAYRSLSPRLHRICMR
jgi:hypothetical protein